MSAKVKIAIVIGVLAAGLGISTLFFRKGATTTGVTSPAGGAPREDMERRVIGPARGGLPGSNSSAPIESSSPTRFESPHNLPAAATGTPTNSDKRSDPLPTYRTSPLGGLLKPLETTNADRPPLFSEIGPSAGPNAASTPIVEHTVVDGDTLANLAARYLGDSRRAGEIHEANRGTLKSADLLPIGAVLKIRQGGRPAEPPTANPHAIDSRVLWPADAAGTQVNTSAARAAPASQASPSQSSPRLVPIPKGALGR